MTKPIIAALDPHRDDIAPAALGVLLARLTGEPLVLAAAYHADPRVDNVYPDYARTLVRGAEEALARAAAPIRGAAELPVTTIALPSSGSPAWALHDLAEREGAGALVIGSSSRGPMGRVLPGAVTDRLLHGAPCPVAVAPAGFNRDDAGPPRLVGVAFVDRPDGHVALATARTLAGQARAAVRVLTVAEPLDLVLSAEPEIHDAARQASLQAAEATLARADEPAQGTARSCPVTSRAPSPRPLRTSICSSAGRVATARSEPCCSAARRIRSCARRPARCSSSRSART